MCFMQKNGRKVLQHSSCSPLPSYRVANDFGFTSVGIEYAERVFVKNIYESDGTMYKAYIIVITWTVTRAIHLELSPDLEQKNADFH